MSPLVTENGIDVPFNQPFFSGTAPGNAFTPKKYQVAINGQGFIIDEKQYDRETIALRREPTDESVEPGEQSLNTQGVWRRSQDNWFLGAGQEYLDNRFAFVSVYTHSGQDPSIRTRFWKSKGVNPWVEGALSLLPECNQKKASTHTGQIVLAVGANLYYWDGAALYFTSNPTAVSPTWTSVAFPTGLSLGAWPTITSLTTDGVNVFAAVGAYGVFTTANGTATSTNLRVTPTGLALSGAGSTGGGTTYTYFVVATDANGYKSLVSAQVQTTTGQAVLNAANPIIISWTPVNGAVSYDVLKTNISTLLGTTTQTSLTDTGQATSAYTAPTGNTLNFQCNFLVYANGFLVGADGNVLAQVLRNGMTSLIWTHPNPNYNWVAGSPSPNTIYLAGFAGNISEIWGVQANSSTGNLNPPYQAGDVTTGEVVNALDYYQGIVGVATSLGVRTGQPTDSSGHLQMGPVITDFGNSKCIAAFGAYLYAGWSLLQTNDGIYPTSVSSSGLGRLFLSEFTDSPLLPAFASDVMATDGTTGTITSCAVDEAGNAYFTLDGNGIWGPDGNVVASGYVEPGFVRYGIIQSKIIVSMDVRHDSLPAGASVTLQVVPFAGTAELVGVSNGQGSIGPTSPFGTDFTVGEAFMPILTLTRATSPTVSPVLRRWTVEALPVVKRQDQIVVPIRMGRLVKSANRQGEDLRYDPLLVFQQLKSLEANSAIVQYQEGNATYTCIIDQVKVKADKWADDFSFFEGIIFVKLITLDI